MTYLTFVGLSVVWEDVGDIKTFLNAFSPLSIPWATTKALEPTELLKSDLLNFCRILCLRVAWGLPGNLPLTFDIVRNLVDYSGPLWANWITVSSLCTSPLHQLSHHILLN